MLFSKALERFINLSPIPVMVRILLERVLSPENIDTLFERHAENQYCRELLFSTLFDMMGLVVTKVFPSINAVYVSKTSDIGVSISSVYNKLNGLEPVISSALVRETAVDMKKIIDDIGGRKKPLLAGFRIKMLDGNCIEASERRLSVLRDQSAAPLPGKSLVFYEPELELATHVFPCEDGHAQERSLLGDVLKTVEEKDLIISDRNFCVRTFLGGIHQKNAFFICRYHQQVPYEEKGKSKFVGNCDTGRVFEQWIEIDNGNGQNIRVRRIVIKLKSKTRDGDTEIVLLTNLSKKSASALVVADLYRKRWSIETVFQELESHLNSEINALGYPRAALFGFSVSLVAYNVMSVIKAALRTVHGEETVANELSGYYIAGEIERTQAGMNVAIPDEEWDFFNKMDDKKFSGYLIELAKNVEMEKYKKKKRSPKKPPLDKKPSSSPHVSTFKLLNSVCLSP
jgi:hypothetical protein